MKIVSWNVNGVRAAYGKGLLDWMAATKADVYCLQEVKATVGDVQHIVWPQGYEVFWNSAQKKGYSGTALLCRRPPLAVVNGIGSPEHDAEGRAVTAEFDDCYVIGVYVPNAQPELARIAEDLGAKMGALKLTQLLECLRHPHQPKMVLMDPLPPSYPGIQK